MFVCLQSDHIFPCGKKKKRMLWFTGAILIQSSAELPNLSSSPGAVGRSSQEGGRGAVLQLVPHFLDLALGGLLALMPVLRAF